MSSQNNISLQPYNSFHLDVKATEMITVTSVDEIQNVFAQKRNVQLILGGGSNILLTRNVEGLVLKVDIKGIEEIREEDTHVFVKAGAGENWHGFVQHAVQHRWGGLENLSLIPGSVGAAPIQNIGAYGVELKDVFYELEAYDRKENKVFAFGVNDCHFGYRDSIFKSGEKGRYIILNVTFILKKDPVLNTSYGAIRDELKKMNITTPTIADVSNAVINIRRSKLPDPAEIGNAGSFFKNPVVNQQTFRSLSSVYPNMPVYPHEDKSVKLAAGWLIEQCGWKGYRKDDAGVHINQALVLVNYGHATGKQILDLSEKIMTSVRTKFGVKLEREVNIY